MLSLVRANMCLDFVLGSFLALVAVDNMCPDLIFTGFITHVRASISTGFINRAQWASLEEWMSQQHFNVFEPGLIMNPVLGVSIFFGPFSARFVSG